MTTANDNSIINFPKEKKALSLSLIDEGKVHKLGPFSLR